MKIFNLVVLCFSVIISYGAEDHTFGDTLPNSCIGKEDGTYWFLFSSENSDEYVPVRLDCSNEYVILNMAKDSNVHKYFSTFEMWHYKLAGPSNNNPTDWEDWFLKPENNENAKYLLSPDCNVCNERSKIQTWNTKTTYWMTGNLAKLHWPVIGFNECDMDWNTYQCYDCQTCMQITVGCTPMPYEDNTTDFTHAGICGVTVQPSTHEVYPSRRQAQLASGIINYKPSIGTENEFCICYQPEFYQEYSLTDEQEQVIQKREIDAELEAPEKDADRMNGEKTNENEKPIDLRDTRIVYLSQKNFQDGTYRIRQSGTYIISEDIVFNFNPDDDYWPREDQQDDYPGAATTRDPYHLGFFAGITIESDYVTIDLNSHELKMGLEFYYQQRWFAIIELGNQQFLPGQGPAFFGPDPKAISEITITNGILGRTSHFGIHGNFPTGLTITNVQIKDFVTHGMQLNGWNNLVMDNIEIGPSSTIEYLRGDYGHGRIIAQRLRWIEQDMISNGMEHQTVTFAGREIPMTVSDIADELELQLEMAFDYAVNRANNDGYDDNDYINPVYTSDIIGQQRWREAKKQFVHESGLPSASSITGMFLNFEGASVFSYTMYTERQSKHGKISNVYIHDIYHDMVESMRLSERNQGGQMYPTPWNSDIPAEAAFGTKEIMLDFHNVAAQIYSQLDPMDIDGESSEIEDAMKDFTYKGSALADAYFGMAEFSDDWDYLGFLETNSPTARRGFSDWVFGNKEASVEWVFGCNQDIMGHSGKGIVGFRMDGVSDVTLDNIVIENLHQHTPLGSYACGNYYRFTPQESGGHFKQSEPMQWGFSSNDLQAMSIISSTDVLIGDLRISNLENEYSQSYGLSFWTGNDIYFRDDSLILIENVKAGTKLEKGSLDYMDMPNRSPEACAVRLEIDDTSDYYDSFINVNDEMNGATNIISCGFDGHETCLGAEDSDYTMFGKHYSNQECNNIKSFDDLQAMIKTDNSDKSSLSSSSSLWNHVSVGYENSMRNYIGSIVFIGLTLSLLVFGLFYCYTINSNTFKFESIGNSNRNYDNSKGNYGSV